jgi:hypothetical protein
MTVIVRTVTVQTAMLVCLIGTVVRFEQFSHMLHAVACKHEELLLEFGFVSHHDVFG